MPSSILTSKLAKAFFDSAQANDAEIYVDSFGKPYFFHRTRFEADLVSQKPRERVFGLFLLGCKDDLVLRGRLMEPAQAREFFRTLISHDGVTDSLGKELFGAKLSEQYRIQGDMGAVLPNKIWDWSKCIFHVVDSNTGIALMRIERYPMQGEEA